MKKTLIALAVLAASGASFAQVTLYGAVSTAFKNQKASNVLAGVSTDTRADGFTNGEVDGSDRWGMRGSEDLGGGLSATFNLESDLTTATGAATAGFVRQSTVGLAGSFGAVRFGRSLTPIHVAIDATDVNATQGLTTVNLSPVVRASNAVFYATPNTFGGFYANAMYGTTDTGVSGGTNGGNNAAASTSNQGLSLGYKSGPLHVVGAMTVLNTTTQTAGALAVDGKTDGQALGLTYDFGPAKLFANTSRFKAQANGGIDTKTENSETNLGVSVPMGAFTFMGAMGRNTRTETVAGVEVVALNNGTATLPVVSGTGSGNDWVLGVDYALSKRTKVFAKTGVVNKITFGATAGAAPIGGTANSIETSATAIGLRHTF